MKSFKQVEEIDMICELKYQDLEITEAEYQGKTVKIKKVSFGDTTGLSIKRDDPARRKSFRARHSCDTAKDKTTARYWSCYQWRANAPVNN